MRALRLLLLILLAPALLQAGAPPSPGEQKAQIERGKRIYLEGVSPSGAEITAVMSEASVEVPASAVPCAGCHGRDGKGRPEGGVSPTDLTWQALTKPYGVTLASGRKHPAYDEKTLKRAIAMGLDPAGNPLHVAMPRFRMNQADMADLVAYMKQLGTEKDPGVSESELRIGVLLPPAGPLSPMAQAIRSAVSARFDQVNKNGGIYGRRLTPRFFEASGPPEQRRSWTADFLTREQIFAGAASFVAGADSELAGLFAEKEIPLVGPFTLHPRESVPLNRYVFYLLPGVEIQAQALARFVKKSPGAGAPRPAIVVPNDKALDEAVKALRKIAAAEKWPEPLLARSGRPGFTPDDVARLAGEKADPVFFLGSGPDARVFLQAADRLGWRPRVLVTAPAADASLFDVPAGFDGRVFAAMPTAPSLSAQGTAAYRELDAAAKLPGEHLSAQLSALASADILIEGLRRAGRDISRDKLITQLEALRKLDTGFAPPVTYGPNRRLGARGAYVVKLDLQKKRFEPVGGWVEVE
ncbi:MAG TPA: ABC transporter substrate-binding protein [Thermoanaerobaculia bacterium]|nr:ABC transporter substrate-binding protein [Thermoanaerobaculia bacterium]